MNKELIYDLRELSVYLDNTKDSNECKKYNSSLKKVVELLNSEANGESAVEIIRQALEKYGVSQTELAERMGNTRQNVSQMLDRGRLGMRCDSFQRMAKALDCELILRKK